MSVTFTLLSVAVASPVFPEIDAKALVLARENTSESKNTEAVRQGELCRWQKDFAFFSDLKQEKKTEGQGTPCAEVVANPIMVRKGAEQNVELDTLIRQVASGYPIEAMASTIAEYDRGVAALIVGIAKKESNWGKRVPLAADGTDCYNYWGFKGAGSRGVAMGHGCFGSPEEAVHAVGNRIAALVDIKQTSEPKNMVVTWKCGSSCATHSPESVRKWISDVDVYYRKIALK